MSCPANFGNKSEFVPCGNRHAFSFKDRPSENFSILRKDKHFNISYVYFRKKTSQIFLYLENFGNLEKMFAENFPFVMKNSINFNMSERRNRYEKPMDDYMYKNDFFFKFSFLPIWGKIFYNVIFRVSCEILTYKRELEYLKTQIRSLTFLGLLT